jgi:hypothetical protein
MKKEFWKLTVIAAVFGIFITGCTTTVRQHPDFEQRRADLKKAAIMRPKAEIVLIKFKGDNERLTNEEKFVCSKLQDLVMEHLQEQGFEVVDNNSTGLNLADDSDLSFKATELSKSCESLANEMWKISEMDKKKALSYKTHLGPEVNIFSDYYNSDMLVFLCMSGFDKSKEERSKDFVQTLMIAFLSGGNVTMHSYGSFAACYVMLVDGASGDVLWANMTSYPEIKFDEKHLKELAKMLFKDFPKIPEKGKST